MDRERLLDLVDRKVAVRLKNVEARGVELIATLDRVRDDGVVLREVGELGPGPTIFCPWDSLHRVRERPPWLAPPHEEPVSEGIVREEPWPGESYYIREAPADEGAPEPARGRQEPSARTLERAVPVGQKRSVGDVTVALTALELHGEGLGVLRWLISLGEEALRREPDFGFGIPEPVFRFRHAESELPWSPRGGGAGDGESDGEVEVRDLPESGELVVEVMRLEIESFDSEDGPLRGTPLEGPWIFRFSL